MVIEHAHYTKVIFRGATMNLGQWDKGVIKAILITSLIVPAYALVELGIPDSLDALAGLGMFFLLFYSVYLLFSVIGWVFVGFPSHWVICKFGSGRLVWYLFAVGLFSMVIYFTFKEVAVVYGMAALAQALLFKHYAYYSK